MWTLYESMSSFKYTNNYKCNKAKCFCCLELERQDCLVLEELFLHLQGMCWKLMVWYLVLLLEQTYYAIIGRFI